MSYLKWLWGNIKFYRKVKQKVREGKLWVWEGKLPSQVYFKYPPEHTFSGRKVLNVGCGKCVYKAPNVTNVDIGSYDGINVVWDLSKTPLPFESNSFDFIVANHVLEHVPNWFECVKELARIVRPGGMIEIWIPPISGDTAFSYRDHINRIGIYSFAGCLSNRQAASNLMADGEFHDGSLGDFADLELAWAGYKTIVTWWMLFVPECIQRWMVQHLRNVVSEEGFKFIKRVKP